MVLSALVYPGAGQFMQRRWVAGAGFAAAFTVPLVWFVVKVFAVLKAYYEFAFNFSGATGQAPCASAIILPFGISVAVYVACLVDVAIAAYRLSNPGNGTPPGRTIS
jgi:hypothetical protein